MRPGIVLARFLDRFAAVDIQRRSDGVGLFRPLRFQLGLLGDGSAEIKLFAVLVEPADEIIAGLGRVGGLGGVLVVLDGLRTDCAAAVGVEGYIIVRCGLAPDVSDVVVVDHLPGCTVLTIRLDLFVEELVRLGEVELDLDIGRLVVLVDFFGLRFQRSEHFRVVDRIAVFAAVTMRPRIGLALVLDRFVPIDAEVGSDDVGVRLPLCGENHVARGDGVGIVSLEERFIGRIVCAVSAKLGGIIFIRNDFNAPALEGIAFAGRVGGHGDCAAGDVVVVDIAVVVHRHGFRRCAVATVFKCRVVERQEAVEVIAFALARVTIVAVVVGQVLQLRPNGLADICSEAHRILMRGVGVGFQLALDGIEPGTSDIRHLLERRQILRRGHFADRDPLFVGVVIAAVLAGRETGTCERVRVQRKSDVLLRFILGRVLVNQLHALGIDGLDEEVDRCGAPLRRQGDIGGDGGIKAERFFCLIQIPAVEGIAGLLGSSRLGRLAFVFHVPREGGLAIVRVEGHDPVVRDRADIICTRRDGVGRPDVVRNVVTDIIVRIFLGRRVQSPLNRVLRQQLVCARGVREVLVVACLCANVNKFVDFERRDVAAGSACFRFHRHNVLFEIDERYGDAIVADIQTAVHAEGMDAVILAAGCDLGNLAPVGRRMGELDQIVNAAFYRLGCPRIAIPADVPAQRFLGVQVVRRILLERLHKVCDREGHDPCGSILALFKLIVLSDDARPCGILPLTAVHVVVAVLPEAVDAGNGDKAGQRIEDFVLRGFGDLRGGVALDFDVCKIAALDLPFGACSVVFKNKLNGVSGFSRRMPGVWIIAVIGIHVGLNIEPNRVFAVFNFFTASGNRVGFDLVRLFLVSRARGAVYSHAVQRAQIVVRRCRGLDFRRGAFDFDARDESLRHPACAVPAQRHREGCSVIRLVRNIINIAIRRDVITLVERNSRGRCASSMARCTGAADDIIDVLHTMIRRHIRHALNRNGEAIPVDVGSAGRGDRGGGLLRNEVNSVVILRLDDCISTRIKGIDNRIVAIRLRPADKFITLFQNFCCQQFLRSCLDRSNGNGVRANAVWAARTMQRTGEGLLLPQVGLVAQRVDAVINVQDIAVDLRVVVSGGCTLKIIVSSVLAVCKICTGAFASFVAAAASPGNVVDLIVVYTFPDVLGIRKSERIIVDVVLAKVNRDVVAADACNRMAIDLVAGLDFHAGDSVVHRRMQHDRAITRRHRRHRQHAEHHNQNQQKSNESLFHYFGSPPFYCLFRVVETDLC